MSEHPTLPTQQDTIILTANKRLANWLIRQKEHNSPNVLSVTDWLISLFTTANTSSVLLNSYQEQAIWQSIIHEAVQNELISVAFTAKLAQKAWESLKQWNIPIDDSRLCTTTDSQTFVKWAKEFAIRCKNNNWIDNASLADYVYEQFTSNALTYPSEIVLVGFLELSPQIKRLCDLFEQNGTTITTKKHNNLKRHKVKTAQPNTETEIYAMATWAKDLVTNKKSSIGCIVPNLNEHRADIERIFNDVFVDTDQQYNISSGSVFLNEPMIYSAYEILQLINKDVAVNDIGYLLRSPYISGHEQEFAARALCDFAIRKFNYTKLNLGVLKKLVAKLMPLDSTLSTNLKQLIKTKSDQKYLPNKWAMIFSQQLKTIGWPGDRALNNKEQQTRLRWQKLLNEFAALNAVLKQINITQALYHLKQLAQQTLFQVKTSDTAPIQILGMLEATGMTFTNLWIMGLDNKHWPAPAKPNPLLPTLMQRQLNMPHTSSNREYYFSELVTENFATSADNIVFSYALKQDDEELQPSALIKNIDEAIIDPAIKSRDDGVCKSQDDTNDFNFAEPTPYVTEKEITEIGTEIFKLQSACPFRAFAEIRLHTQNLIEPEQGITSLTRGVLIHTALELFWLEIKSHKKLIALSETDLKSCIENITNETMKKVFAKTYLNNEIKKIEEQRLQKMLFKWLTLEKTRQPFEVVAQEHRYKTKIADLNVSIRIDRIDQTQNGEFLLIDYKTGQSNIASWFGERPDDPQLPFYSISYNKEFESIAFAQISSRETKFKTISKTKGLLPEDKTLAEVKSADTNDSWEEQLQIWKQTITNLANDFIMGKADVDPKDTKTTCQYCKLHSLCRIHEQKDITV